MTDDLASILASLPARQEQSALLLAAYESASPATRRRAALAEYRCRAGRCLLLLCWQAPAGRLVYVPHFKLSKARNERDSVPAARKKNTSDGYRHWNARVVILDELAGWGSAALSLTCDHVSETLPILDLFVTVEAAAPGQPARRVVPS